MIALYKTKVIEIEISDPLTADNRDDILAWIEANGGEARPLPDGYKAAMVVYTLEGHHDALYGDRIIRGTRGEFYPIKPEPFADKYEPA